MLKDQRILLSLGALTAIALAVVFALITGGKTKDAPPPPASQSGLQVSVNEPPALNAAKPLRCFVNGQFVGMATLADCAKRNGVAAQALDVGVDANGALTAAPTASLAPPPVAPYVAPSQPAVQPPAVVDAPLPQAAEAGPPGACLRFAGGEWRTLSDGMSQSACLRVLFAGKCVRPGEADYGRWGETTLRLVFPSQVQASPDNHGFHTLFDQSRACDAAGGRG